MKSFPHLLLLATVFLIFPKTIAQTPRATARLTHATVFANRAQLLSTVKTTVEAGSTELLIDHIADQLDPQSIQLSGQGDVVIQGVSFNQNFLQNPPKSPVVRRLEDSLRSYKDQLADLGSARDVIQQEKDLLVANRQVGGPQGGATIEKIEQLTAYFRRRMTDLNAKLRENTEQQTRVTERVNRVQNQLNALGQRRNQPTGELRVRLQAPRRTDVELELSYVALDASWAPAYDLRAPGSSGPVQLVYKATVSQSTGLDWENIRLTLSSANPSLSSEAPELSPRFVDFYEPRPMPVRAPAAQSKRGDFAGSDDAQAAGFAAPPPVGSLAEVITVADDALTVQFDIPVPYTVRSNDSPTVVDIQRHELPARYRYVAVPRLEWAAFLQVELNGWEKLRLLRGRASVFLEGTYVGNTELNPQNPEDTLRISLGRDRRVLVKLEDVRSETAPHGVQRGSGERETRAYRITVRNTKTEPIDLTVDDQVPISRTNQITVDDVAAPGAERDEATGRLRWQFTLKPGESRILDFRYTVRHPKGRAVVGL